MSKQYIRLPGNRYPLAELSSLLMEMYRIIIYLFFFSFVTVKLTFVLQIYDGKDNTAHLLGAYTGASLRGLTLSSTSNHLWLEFNSDMEGTDEGFQLVYTSKYLRKD